VPHALLGSQARETNVLSGATSPILRDAERILG